MEWEKKVTSHVTMTLPFITLHFQQRFWKSLRSQSPWLRHNYCAVISIIPKKPNYLLWVWPYLTHIIWQFFDSVHYFVFSANLRVHHQTLQHNYCATVIPKRPNLYYYEWRTTPCYAPKMCDRLCHFFHWIVFDCVLITIPKLWWVYKNPIQNCIKSNAEKQIFWRVHNISNNAFL